MALTTAIITGRAPLPSDEPIIYAELLFTLSGLDTEGGDILLPGVSKRAVLVDSEMPSGFDLWCNVAGLRATHYEVLARWKVQDRDGTHEKFARLPSIQVLEDDDPQPLATLLNVGVPPAQQVVVSFYPPGTLESFVTEAEDAATAAAASEVSAEADAVATAADRVQTGLDRTAITSGSIWLIQNLTEKVVLGLGTLLVISEQDFDLVVGATTYVIPTVTLEFPT